jgi:hypothetical protein
MVALIALSVCPRGANAAISHAYRWAFWIQVDDEIYFAGISRFHRCGEVMRGSALARSLHRRTLCSHAIRVFGVVRSVVLGRINVGLYEALSLLSPSFGPGQTVNEPITLRQTELVQRIATWLSKMAAVLNFLRLAGCKLGRIALLQPTAERANLWSTTCRVVNPSQWTNRLAPVTRSESGGAGVRTVVALTQTGFLT